MSVSLLVALFVVIALAIAFHKSEVVVYIPNSRVGIVEKLWSKGGSLKGGLIALAGEAGYQPDVLRGGFHFFPPFQYRVHKTPLVTITQGQLGYVFARDGKGLSAGQTLASNESANNFEDVGAFLGSGGQKGPQRKVLREGTYAINLAQFVVLTERGLISLKLDSAEEAMFAHMCKTLTERDGFTPVVIKNADDKIGVVTVHDGRALPSGEIIAPAVGDTLDTAEFHNNFQDADVFVKHGFRGRQLQVLVDGTYYVNRLFATVDLIEKTIVPIGFAGVVVSYTGTQGADVSGEDYRHGELVGEGCRGVRAEPLRPGKYAFNTFAGQVMLVPTTNFILKWSAEVTSEHQYDRNLKEVNLITKDAFEPTLPLSVVVHIDYKKAPLVVQRFGDINKLVEQTLDPMVSAFFKNVAQTKTLIELLQQRSDIQKVSADEMRAKFSAYSLELQEVLIGTPRSPAGNTQIEEILCQLRDRQVATEQVETYRLRGEAATQERSLREAEAVAEAQGNITRSLLSVEIRQNEGKALVAFASQDAERVRIEAGAESARTSLTGEGEAARLTTIGAAKASAIKAQVDAFGKPEYHLAREVAELFTDAIREGKVAIVPQIQMGGGTGGSGSLVDVVLASLIGQGKLDLSAIGGSKSAPTGHGAPAAPAAAAAPASGEPLAIT